MRDVLPELAEHWRAGRPVAVATVVSTSSSAPRPAGTSMVVLPAGDVLGSVSGGCVDGDAYEQATEVLRSRAPVLRHYGVSDSNAFAVGLTCGGTIEVFTQYVDAESAPWFGEVADAVAAGTPVAVATVVADREPGRVGRCLVVSPDTGLDVGGLGSVRLDEAVARAADGLLRDGASGTLTFGPDGEQGDATRVFVWTAMPAPRMLVFGANEFATALAGMGSFMGYRVTACDARPVFATPSRFPAADEVVAKWPHRYLAEESEAGRLDDRTVICVLTHDPKFDVPVLEVALRLPHVAYVGAMGSRLTHTDRLDRLREAGLSEGQLARLSSPLGLDLGARTPAETAVSIAAEILALRSGASGARLSAHSGPIHRDADWSPAQIDARLIGAGVCR
ncbi:XdhC family protein [Luteipulveratus mongoliensis]|uniref:XshC-Cox1 family protein n=1 Tax=Luteipulveratus mongoliensis TaxID=571913 RepID=A0A0K1JIW4_9MICO|nr:XdhC/CoxI family protein [Luteipulveratus mongoliensis]AKU16652.1 XshC-Cox1 family protein [Luteipulveratus mongoliensis]